MTKYASYTGLVTNEDGTQVSLREGEIWPSDDVTVAEHPDKFTDTEPNSEVAGAFPLEHQQRSTEDLSGDGIEEKRMEGEHPRGYAIPGEDPETGEKIDTKAGAKRSGTATGKVERATRAPGEVRGTSATQSTTKRDNV